MNHLEGRGRRRTESRLRRERPEPPGELVRHITGFTERSRGAGARLRLAFAGGLTVALSAAIASVGGVSYAADAATGAAEVIKRAFAPSKADTSIRVSGINSGGDQYRPGYGFGDPNHNHTGPPAVRRGEGEFAPPLVARDASGPAKRVSATITVSEQAALYFAILAPNPGGRAQAATPIAIPAGWKPVLLTQKSRRGSTRVGGRTVDGPQTKFIKYVMLVPREISFALRVPSNLVKPGATYRIRVVAVDPDGNRSVRYIPFRVTS